MSYRKLVWLRCRTVHQAIQFGFSTDNDEVGISRPEAEDWKQDKVRLADERQI